ncbi:gas vesicle protein [Streptomyces sp. NPDC050738]|uniref:gas vesicle protein GvpO n=1 Tax=Streptomyces sp. NPDC050738 TaxID=3154744 RepID=UPI00341BBACB
MTNSADTNNTADEAPKKRTQSRHRPARQRRASAVEVLREARKQLEELTGMQAESVSSFERSEDGWLLKIEVLELARVPDTMSLLASYEVELGPDDELVGYRRIRRYERGRADRNA